MVGNKQGFMGYIGLLFGCPLKENVSSCAFNSIRSMELKERLEYWKNMPDEERLHLVNHHLVCIYNKELKQINPLELRLSKDRTILRLEKKLFDE